MFSNKKKTLDLTVVKNSNINPNGHSDTKKLVAKIQSTLQNYPIDNKKKILFNFLQLKVFKGTQKVYKIVK